MRKIDTINDDEELNIPENAIIHCDEISKIFISDGLKVMALQGLDLTINRGEMMAIIGKSGSGKSTLLNMIGGLESPTTGQLYIEGQNLSTFTNKNMVTYRNRTVGFVWQNSSRNLFPYMSVIENVMTPMYFTKGTKKARKDRALMLLESVGMIAHANKFPGQLSGGEQQRVAIAVALANSPSILLADEPTGAVDTSTSNQIFDLFHKLNEDTGITILIVTHDIGLADKVNRTVMISDGKISTEKVRKKVDKDVLLNANAFESEEDTGGHEEYSILDKSHRIQLDEDMLIAAGIDSNKVSVHVEDGRVVISRPE